MKKLTKQNKIILGSTAALVVIIILGIVYAAFSQQLNINGSAVGRKPSWDIHFANLQEVNLTGTAKELTIPSITGTTTIGTYSVSVTSPGDTVSYTFDDNTVLPSTDVSITNLGVTITYAQDENAKVNANGITPLV